METGPEIQRWQDTVLDSHDATSEKSPLASLFSACSELFTLLIHALSQETPQSLLFELQRSHDRLVLWADAYGIEDGEFEGKLKMSQRIGDFTLRTLKSVCRALTQRLLPLVEQHGPRATECSLKAANLSILAEKLSMLVQGDDDSDFSSSDESSDSGTDEDDDDITRAEKLREVAEDLTLDTECLLDLGARFDEQVVNPLVNEEAVDPQTVDGWDPSEHFVERIRRLYPTCDDGLAKRLGKANWERVLKFQESKEKNATESVAIATTTLSTFADPVHLLQDPKDTTSMFHDSGVDGWNNNVLKIPELSAQAKLGHEFSCIACGERLRIQEETNWNFHIITDLQPYMCLEAGCESLIFLSKWSWTRHLERSHDSLDNWAAMMCRFCHKPVPSGMDNIVEHLADHLEKISVMALPSDQGAEPLHAVPPTLSYPSSESSPPVASAPSVQPLPAPPSIDPEFTPASRGKGVQNQPLAMARVLYDFSGPKDNELSVKSGQIIMIVQKETNGWWLAKSSRNQGWVPSTYIEEIDSALTPAQRVSPPSLPRDNSAEGIQAKISRPQRAQPSNKEHDQIKPETAQIEKDLIDYSEEDEDEEDEEDLRGPVQNSVKAPQPQSQPHSQRGQVQAQMHARMQAQRQAMLHAQAQVKGMQGQPAGYGGHLPTPQSPAVSTLNTPVQPPTMMMAQPNMPQMPLGPGAGFRLHRDIPSPQPGETPDRSNLLAAAMRVLPPATLQNFRLMPPEKQNEYLNRLITSRQLRGLHTGQAQSPSTSGSDVTRPGAAVLIPSPATAEAVPSDLLPGVPPEGSARNPKPESPIASAEERPDSGAGVAVEVPSAEQPEGITLGQFASRLSSDTPDLINLDADHTGADSTLGSLSFFGANDPWFPLFPPDTSEMPPPPSSKRVAFQGTQTGDMASPQQQRAAAMVKGKEVEETPEMSLPFIGYAFKRFGPEWSMENEVAAFAANNRPRESRSSSVQAESTSAPSGVGGRRRDKLAPPIIVDDPSDTTAMKRARNTLAARKSRERKAQRLDELEQKIAALEAERNHWKEAFLAKGQDEPKAQDSAGALIDDRHG
ncbi:hypothetical protein LQW54_002282 [Pestalotiopsis sp. IQ-011]